MILFQVFSSRLTWIPEWNRNLAFALSHRFTLNLGSCNGFPSWEWSWEIADCPAPATRSSPLLRLLKQKIHPSNWIQFPDYMSCFLLKSLDDQVFVFWVRVCRIAVVPFFPQVSQIECCSVNQLLWSVSWWNVLFLESNKCISLFQ